MYHGTRTENGKFYVFDTEKAVKRGGLGLQAMGKGIYFTSKRPDGTERYGSRIIQAYLSIKRPFVYQEGVSFTEQVGNALQADVSSLNSNELQKAMRDAGYDGVIQYDKAGNVSIAVTFDSNQIKSATENIGTFKARIQISVTASTTGARTMTTGASRYPPHLNMHRREKNTVMNGLLQNRPCR